MIGKNDDANGSVVENQPRNELPLLSPFKSIADRSVWSVRNQLVPGPSPKPSRSMNPFEIKIGALHASYASVEETADEKNITP